MKLRVAIVVCAWPPHGGGIGNNAYYQARHLSQLDYRVAVFTPDYGNQLEAKEGFEVVYLKSWLRYGKAGVFFSLLKQLKQFDIIHLYYPFFGSDLLVWLFKIFNLDKKLVLHYEMDAVGRGWQKVFFKFYLRCFLGLMIRVSDKIGVLSWDNAKHSYLKKYLTKYSDKFVELPNGVDTKLFQPKEKDQQLMNELGIKNSDRIIVFVGGLDRQHYFKGLEVLLLAFKKLNVNNKRLLIIGDGDLKSGYEQLAQDLGVADQVLFIGWIDNHQLPDYYALAEVFVLPSTERTESFGIVTAEAQACSLPAVISDWPGSRETIINGETGLLVKSSDEKDLRVKLEALFGADEMRQKMGEAGRQRVLEKYSWNVIIKKIDRLYKELQIIN